MNASHVEPRRDGAAIIAPKRAEGPDMVGVGWVRLMPGDPEYRMWDDYLRVTGNAGPRRPGGGR